MANDASNPAPDPQAAAPKQEVPRSSMSAIALSATTREELDRYAREQFDKIREARKALAAEQSSADEAMRRRRKELEAQAHNILARLGELQQREQRLGEAGPAEPVELETLRKQLQEQEVRIELLQAEKDAAWALVQQTQEECEHRLDGLRTEQETLERESQERIETLSRLVHELGEERDKALAKLRQWPTREIHVQPDGARNVSIGAFGLQHTDIDLPDLSSEFQAGDMVPPFPPRELEKLRIERDALAARVAALEEQAQAAPKRRPGSVVDLAAPAGSISDFGLEHTDLKIPDLARELDAGNAAPQLEALEVEQLRGERDALRERLAQMQQDWERHEAEFVEMRQQLQVEAEALTRDAQELYRSKLAHEGSRKDVESQRDLDRQFITEAQEVLRRQMENQQSREAELRHQELEMRLQQAEVREMREIAERDNARERAQLAQERIRIAHLREQLKRGSDNLGLRKDSDPNI